MAVTSPCVWDTDTVQRARHLALLTRVATAVVKVVRATRAIADVLTRTRKNNQWLNPWNAE